MALTNRSKVVVNKTMTFSERLYFPAIFRGLAITMHHLFKRKVTIRYPEQTRKFSPVYRGLHVLKRDEKGAERCTACGLCAVACPAEAITIVAAERELGEESLYREEKYAARYDINMLRCIFCGLCEEACPKEAVYLTDRLLPANFTREEFNWTKTQLLEPLDPNQRVDVSKRTVRQVMGNAS